MTLEVTQETTVFRVGDAVSVAALNESVRKVIGTKDALRQPVVGDEGEVVAVSETDPAEITVVCIDAGGLAYSATFAPGELKRTEAAMDQEESE